MPASKHKQTIDVAKPGKGAASPTSRPIIVKHSEMIKDPTVIEKEGENEPAEATVPAAAAMTRNKVINPPTDSSTTEAELQAEEKEADSAEAPKEEPKEKNQEVVDTVLDTLQQKKEGPSDEELARQAELEKLIASKKYFIPVGKMTRRRKSRRLVMFMLLLVVLAGGYAVIDAGIVDVGVDLPFDLI